MNYDLQHLPYQKPFTKEQFLEIFGRESELFYFIKQFQIKPIGSDLYIRIYTYNDCWLDKIQPDDRVNFKYKAKINHDMGYDTSRAYNKIRNIGLEGRFCIDYHNRIYFDNKTDYTLALLSEVVTINQ